MSKKLYLYIVIERNNKLSITSVRIFKEEQAAWNAIDSSKSEYVTLHTSGVE